MSLCNVTVLVALVGVTSALFFPPCSEVGCVQKDDPVCASNGVTYANPCDLATAACKDRCITAVHRGACVKVKNCPTICFEIYAPVCGSDGKTYSNACYLNVATCQTNGAVTMVSKQPCESSTKRPTSRPSASSTTNMAINKRKNCPSGCFAVWEPVCGSDGKTYSNSCTLDIANCESNGKVKMSYRGTCRSSSTPAPRPVGRSTTMGRKTCPSFCMTLWAPVCGSDGKTYSNTCFLNIATCKSNGKITMVSKRPC